MINWKEFFYFNKSDRIAYGFIATIAVVACLGIYFGGGSGGDEEEGFFSDNSPLHTDWRDGGKGHANGTGNGFYDESDAGDEAGASGTCDSELFPFDPNTADSTTLKRLGLSSWMIKNIYKYRAAGGVYRNAEDFARVYGITKKQYEALAPYIRISDDYRPASEFYKSSHNSETASRQNSGNGYVPRDTILYPIKLKPGQRVSLNSADTTQLKKIPGIGSAYARAIVRRREKLGGFYSASQLMEIDGFPQEALAYLHIDASSIHKLNINKLSYSQLRQHPYLNHYQARDIIDCRRLRGPLKSLSDLRLMKSFTANDMERLKHYVDF